MASSPSRLSHVRANSSSCLRSSAANGEPERDAILLRDEFLQYSRFWRGPRSQVWERAYTLREFATLVRQVDAWERGWMLGRTMELVETGTYLIANP